jgi:hypothetical protein
LHSEQTAPAHAAGADTLASDVLRGVNAIAAFLGEKPRRVNYLIRKRRLPVGRDGGQWIASRRVLRQHYERLTSGRAA